MTKVATFGDSVIPRGGLIVSCQARIDNPLHGAPFMAAMARAAEQAGCCAIRANGAADIAAIKGVTGLPVIGIAKLFSDVYPVAITPSFAAARALVEAGADIVAVDATPRPRDGEDIAMLIGLIRDRLRTPVFADVSTLEEGLCAQAAGASFIATTLSGYTDATRMTPSSGPDVALVEALARACRLPIIAEGRYDTPALAREALDRGAHAVVVGTMITNPREIARRFVAALK